MRITTRACLIVTALQLSTLACGAPASALGDESSNSPGVVATPDGRTSPSPGATDGTGSSSGNRTIDRLLSGQPQDSNDSSGSDKAVKKLVEGTLPAKVAAGASAASAANPFAELQAVILGNRDAKAKQPQADQNPDLALARRREVEQLSSGPRSSSQEGATGHAAGESNGVAVKFARFIRENRVLVIGSSLLILALVWGAATFASQRRR